MEYCPNCGEELQQNGPFCGNCGSKVGDRTTSSAERPNDDGSDDPSKKNIQANSDDRRFIPKQKAGIIGVAVGLLSSLGIMGGSMVPLAEECTYYGLDGTKVTCSTVGGILTDPGTATGGFVVGLILFLIVIDDYKHLGILGSWEPRKTRLYGVFGSFVIIYFLIMVSDASLQWGGALLLVSGAVLLGFASLVGFWRIAFRKKMGAK